MDAYGFQRRDREIPTSNNPSFSSTLLDAIYRSIDGGGEGEEEDLVGFGDSMRKKKQSNCSVIKGSCKNGGFLEDDVAGLRRVCMIEKWMEQKVGEQAVVRRKSTAEVDRKMRAWNSSSSGSSDSSCGGVFSSSEAESVVGVSSGSSCYGLNRPKPKPVRTGNPPQVKTKKSRALKIYGDLKKAKQGPISPGGRLASFLNSLFTAKKAKFSDEDRKVKSANASTCSSASSFSRSCLSKTTTPSSSSAAGKRSVRFYPVSVIVDEDSRPCGHKNLELSVKEELQLRVMEKNRRVEEAARDLLRNYQKKVEREFDLRNTNVVKNLKVFENVEDDDDEEDDDAASYASSDLFELDNLSAIGMERYSEELPVYETTHLDTNRAIANGLIL
ncbi:PREDICTED: protein BIG GRAIN 1-like A isoform X2 [Ipomoea nil]|uniref:protein BIG GRAIN 1-like A isoform X2 n=1 Tax=Ipomoea nil TaxID=35883 RepID=UPI0009010991|nr:PREDICTED: protein BIG GRAIN 1-like A isoform X2 [Ipomoea nil]